ncbi:amidohydrolase family protein [Rhodococcus sp. X156]|uniref:N-acyl-D-amino-acid deacylase family protein n=1 Tax=Rhodococcus sp. X156 TaxID=2499145 RepID=UPI000FDC9ABE|nr:amidohydrolase family protein [Rhodococcus sp. X156]
MSYDTIIAGGLVYDGTGAAPRTAFIGIRDGVVVALSTEALQPGPDTRVVDATGKWVLPGLIDIHTHYDVEVLHGPGLPESVRHGVTTVFIGSCSLSTIHVDGEVAGDLFGRVEAIPRGDVIRAVDTTKTWSTAGEYVAALERLPLGPNLAAFLGHSDARAAVMGLDRSTRPDVRPTRTEQARLEEMLEEALDAGFVGMSSQQLLFDKLDGQTCRSRTLPSTYAKPRELRRLQAILRRRSAILQSGPDIKNPRNVVSQLVTSLGLGRPRLKTSLLSAADIKANPAVIHLMGPLSRTINRLGGDFRWQHLPVPFEVYADGIDLVIFEEFGSGAAALHLSDAVQRDALLRDEDYRRKFRKDYDEKWGLRVWHRDFFDAEIVECPDASVVGKSFGQVGIERDGLHPVDAFLDLVLEHGKALRWHTTISNHRPELLKKMAVTDGIQMGFSDAGAHLRNMAFYNMGLRLLRHVHDAQRAGAPFMTVERAVHRLTGELADWYGIDAGHLRLGDRADLLVVDPEHLGAELDEYHENPVEQYGGLSRMVNRNDAAVPLVLIAGRVVVEDGTPTELLGAERTGSFLRAGASQATTPSAQLAATR